MASAFTWQTKAPPKPSIASIGAKYSPGGMYGTNTTQWNPALPHGVQVQDPGYVGGQTGGSGFAKGPDFDVPRGHMVTPDYSGILGSFTADARARFGAGSQAMEAQRLSQARAVLNRLGVRDVPGLLDKVKGFGITQEDLQGAADNPWSELKALDFNANRAWQGGVASRAARGGYRSGGTIGLREDIDLNKARSEAGMTQDALGQLSEGQFAKANWEREQRDQMEQAIANQQAQLAAAYQPYWVQD